MNVEALSKMDIATLILATGALGTASFGIVDALKWTRVGESGYSQIPKTLGKELMNALKIAYGENYNRLLRALYRKEDKSQRDLARTLRQGIRVGLNQDNAEDIAKYLGVVGIEPDKLKKSLNAFQAFSNNIDKEKEDEDVLKEHRPVMGRFELAVDARIDAALILARDNYIGWMRVYASLISIVIAFSVALKTGGSLLLAVIVGIAAVPVAPIAKDLVNAIQSASKALSAKK